MRSHKSGVGFAFCLFGMLASTDLIAVMLVAVVSDMILQLSISILMDAVLAIVVDSLSWSSSCTRLVASSEM